MHKIVLIQVIFVSVLFQSQRVTLSLPTKVSYSIISGWFWGKYRRLAPKVIITTENKYEHEEPILVLLPSKY